MAVQDNVANVFMFLATFPILDGYLVTNIPLVSGTNVINHTLGRQPVGWIVTDRNGAATVYRTAWDARTITLNSSGTVTISAWVF